MTKHVYGKVEYTCSQYKKFDDVDGTDLAEPAPGPQPGDCWCRLPLLKAGLIVMEGAPATGRGALFRGSAGGALLLVAARSPTPMYRDVASEYAAIHIGHVLACRVEPGVGGAACRAGLYLVPDSGPVGSVIVGA